MKWSEFLKALDYTDKEEMEAVKHNGFALQYVREPTLELCMAAVKQDGYALAYVKDQTEAVCIAAVKQDGKALQYVQEPTLELCMAAVKQDGYALRHVKDQTLELCMAAVKQDGKALRFVKDQTLELCMEAVKQDGKALLDVKKQTPELCLAVVRQNRDALRFIDMGVFEPESNVNKEALRPEFIQLRKWVGAMDIRFVSWEESVEVEIKADHVNIYLYTNKYKYAIQARCKSPDRSSYLGCTVGGHGKFSGGRDLADGDFSEGTWRKILSDIVSWEMIPASTGRTRINWDKASPDPV